MRSSASTFAWKRCSSAARSAAVVCRQSAPRESRPCVYILSSGGKAGRANVTHFFVRGNCFCVMFIGVSADALTRRTEALLARFRRQRPLRGGSLLVTILGDAIAPRGGVIALGSLIELARPFGITDRHVRTAIGRLANEEWVSSQRSGRVSFYRLTNHGRARSAGCGLERRMDARDFPAHLGGRTRRAARGADVARLRPIDERSVRASDASRRHRARASRGARIGGRRGRDPTSRRHALIE